MSGAGSGGRVMFVAPSAYPLGGVAVWLDYLAKGLPAFGWAPLVGLTSGKWHDVGRYRAAYSELPVLAIENPTGSAEGRIRAIVRAIEHARPDVVVGVNIVDLYAASRRLRERYPAMRTVMALHGIAADLLGDLKREAGAMDAVIATNRLACRLCVDHAGMLPERVFYAPYGVDIEALSALPRPPESKTLNIAWVGRLAENQKQISLIAPILTSLDNLGVDYVLRIAGDGPERPALLGALKQWLISGRVEYIGALTVDRVGSQAYAKADALLLTSSWETGPIVIWEAMAAGLAVVSSRYVGCGLEAALRDTENCLMFPLGDSEAAALQLARLRDTVLRKRLVEGGANLVAERYSIGRSVKEWAVCLKSVMNLPPRQVGDARANLPAAGRLDNMLGVSLGETVRNALAARFEHSNPGGEWPHTAVSDVSQDALFAIAKSLDFDSVIARHPFNE